jgi:hypothetical protein
MIVVRDRQAIPVFRVRATLFIGSGRDYPCTRSSTRHLPPVHTRLSGVESFQEPAELGARRTTRRRRADLQCLGDVRAGTEGLQQSDTPPGAIVAVAAGQTSVPLICSGNRDSP